MAGRKSTSRAVARQTAASLVETLPIGSIIPGPNPRENFDDEGLRSLADSILKVGLIEPIVVRPLDEDAYEIVCGERRWRACSLLGLDAIEAKIREVDDLEAAELRLLENLSREDLNPIEEASALRQLRELGHDVTSLANIVRRSEDEVERRESLLRLPPAWRDLIIQGKLSGLAGEVLLDWLDLPQVLDAMLQVADRWPMPLANWKRSLQDACLRLSRNMDADAPDGPLFTPTDEQLQRLDVREWKTSPSPASRQRRAFNSELWDELQDAAVESDATAPSAMEQPATISAAARSVGSPDQASVDDDLIDESPEPAGPVFDDAFRNRLLRWQTDRYRSIITAHLQTLDLDELQGLLEMLDLQPAWRLDRSFLNLHNDRQLSALCEDLGVDVTDCESRDETYAVLEYIEPTRLPASIRELEDAAEPAAV